MYSKLVFLLANLFLYGIAHLSIKNIVPLLNHNKNILHVHDQGILYACLTADTSNQHTVISKTYSDTVNLPFTKYFKPVNIIMAKFDQIVLDDNHWAHTSMRKLLAVPETILILIDDQDASNVFDQNCKIGLTITKTCKYYLDFKETPAFKILLSFSKSDVYTDVFVITNEYCSGEITRINSKNINALTSTTELRNFYKKCFWYEKNEVPAYVVHALDTFYHQSKNKIFACDVMFKTRIYNQNQMIRNKYCWAKQMLAIELSKRHNITFIYSRKNGQYLYQNDVRYNLKSQFSKGIYLQYYSGWSYHYCLDYKLENHTTNSRYHTFVRPMPLNLWALMALAWLSIALLYTFRDGFIGTLQFIQNFIVQVV